MDQEQVVIYTKGRSWRCWRVKVILFSGPPFHQ